MSSLVLLPLNLPCLYDAISSLLFALLFIAIFTWSTNLGWKTIIPFTRYVLPNSERDARLSYKTGTLYMFSWCLVGLNGLCFFYLDTFWVVVIRGLLLCTKVERVVQLNTSSFLHFRYQWAAGTETVKRKGLVISYNHVYTFKSTLLLGYAEEPSFLYIVSLNVFGTLGAVILMH